MTESKIVEQILYALFSDEELSLKVFNRLNSDQLDDIYHYLYKQKILQLSYDYLKQLPLSNEDHVKMILLKTSEYIQKTNSRDNMLREGLCSSSKYLTQKGIEHISLKGPLFSEIYFNSSGKRVCGDIDLLINKCDVLRTKDALIEAGYEIDETLFEKSIVYHYHFEAKKDQITFEIHWNIDYGKNDYWEHLLCNSYFVQINNIDIRVLNNECQFLLFVVSISKDWFTRAGANKYLDLFQIIKHANIDYLHAFKIIEQFGLHNRCYAVLFCLQYFCKRKPCPSIRASIFTKMFSRCFLTKHKVLMCKTSYKFIRQLGEKLLWKDTSFTRVPNIYKDK